MELDDVDSERTSQISFGLIPLESAFQSRVQLYLPKLLSERSVLPLWHNFVSIIHQNGGIFKTVTPLCPDFDWKFKESIDFVPSHP